MTTTTKFNLLERVWAFSHDKGKRELIEVMIDKIVIDFNIVNDGDLEAEISYKIHIPDGNEEWYILENQLFADSNEFSAECEKIFLNRKFNFPKTQEIA